MVSSQMHSLTVFSQYWAQPAGFGWWEAARCSLWWKGCAQPQHLSNRQNGRQPLPPPANQRRSWHGTAGGLLKMAGAGVNGGVWKLTPLIWGIKAKTQNNRHEQDSHDKNKGGLKSLRILKGSVQQSEIKRKFDHRIEGTFRLHMERELHLSYT